MEERVDYGTVRLENEPGMINVKRPQGNSCCSNGKANIIS